MSSPPNLRGPPLTPIPEYAPGFHFPQSNSKSIFPSGTNMELISTPPPGLPLSYYDIPDFFRAIFSTSLGSLPKRELVYPYPAVMVRTNLGIDVQRKCQDLWSRFPDQVRMIGPLARYSGEKAWYELYNFFDAIDLWIETPAFCFSVIHRLAAMNDEIVHENFSQIEEFAKSWVHANSKRLLNVAEHIDVMTLLSPEECQKEEFNLMTEPEIATIRQQLNHFRALLLQGGRANGIIPNNATPPMHVLGGQPQIPQYRQALVNERRNQPTRFESEQTPIRTPQNYHNFMENQRNLYGRVENAVRDNRQRGWSNDTSRGGRGFPRFNNTVGPNGNIPKASEQRDQPVYALAHQRGVSSENAVMHRPDTRSRNRTFSTAAYSNDVRNNTFRARRTLSEENNHPVFPNHQNGERSYNTHSRVVSGSSASTSYACQPSGTETPMSQPDEELSIEGYEYQIYSSGSVTIFYSGPKRIHYAHPSRTVYVSGLPLENFYNHEFKGMMSECGDVDTIKHLRNPAGSAFVLFHDDSGVQNAIDRWNGCHIEPGIKLAISIPKERRDRGYSMSSNNRENGHHHAPYRNSSGQYANNHARTFSANMNGEPLRPNAQVLRDQPIQALWTPLQDIQNISPSKATLQKLSGNASFQPSTPGSSPKKENSPFVTPRKSDNPTPKSHRKTVHRNNKKSQQSSKQHTPSRSPPKSVLEKNTYPEIEKAHKELMISDDNEQIHQHDQIVESQHSLPVTEHIHTAEPQSTVVAAQPGKVEYTTNSIGTAESFTQTAMNAENAHAVSKQSAEAAPKKAKSKSKKKGKNNSGNASFSGDSSSDTIISLVGTEDASFTGIPSTNTSFSGVSSRQPSMSSTRSRKARDMSERVDSVSGIKSETDKGSEKKREATSTDEGMAPRAKNKNRKPSKPANDEGECAQRTSEPGHAKKESTSSSTSKPSARKADTVVKKADRQPTSVTNSSRIANAEKADPKKAGHQTITADEVKKADPPTPVTTSSPIHVKKADSKNTDKSTPIGTPLSVIVAGVKKADNRPTSISIPSFVAEGAAIEPSPLFGSGDLNQSPKSISGVLQSPKQLDEQEWPSLDPIKSPVAAIADGKPPTPLRAPSMGLLAKAVSEKSPDGKETPKSLSPMVAVPRFFQSSRSPSMESIPMVERNISPDDPGTEFWPFVKRFEGR